jgi:molybdopterin-containing oxidoreductase family iron-sulfur binding subunit
MEKVDRRVFLKIASLSLFGLTTGGLFEILNPKDFNKINEAPLKKLKAKRWAMAIDLTTINESIIKNCISECHTIHNVPNIVDKQHEIKWIWQEKYCAVFNEGDRVFNLTTLYKNKNIPVLCNHCDNPPCVRVCPTKATFKRDDGIVVMDMHRCIGCRFCMAACPYGSRSFNWTDPRQYIEKINKKYPTREKGVVEKCDFCMERLDRGEMPVCVEESEGTIIFGDVGNKNSEIYDALSKRSFLRRKEYLGTRPQVFYLI